MQNLQVKQRVIKIGQSSIFNLFCILQDMLFLNHNTGLAPEEIVVMHEETETDKARFNGL